ncbi:hypothetical protein [Streptomyces sp. NPDC002644]
MNPSPIEPRPDITVHRPVPITPIPTAAAPLAPLQPNALPEVASVVLPDGRIVTGYAIEPARTEPVTAKPAVSRTAVNIALGGVGFLAVCGGLAIAASFIAALAALVQQLIVLAAVVFGGWIAAQVLRGGDRRPTTVHIRRAVIKRNHFHT